MAPQKIATNSSVDFIQENQDNHESAQLKEQVLKL